MKRPDCKHLPKEIRGDLLKIADTQTSLAQKLHTYYGDRIRIIISKQRIQHWRGGREMPSPNIPHPPVSNDGRYWNTCDWIHWFDKYMLNHYLRNGETPELDLYALKQDVERRELLLRKKQIEIEEGKWVTLELFQTTCARIGLQLNHSLNQHAERELVRGLRQTITELKLDDTTQAAMFQAVDDGARKAVDVVRAKLKSEIEK